MPKGKGLWVLSKVLTLEREDAETASAWSLRLHKGRKRVSKHMGTNLSDACYRELLFAGLSKREKSELLKAETLRAPGHKHEVGERVMADWDEQGKY